MAEHLEGLPNYYKEERPWGSFERFTLNEPCTVKLITVDPGQEFSLQQHEHRDEEWRVLQGSGTITVGAQQTQAKAGDTFFVARGMQHRVLGGPEGILFLEIAEGPFDEADITRLQDDYGRS